MVELKQMMTTFITVNGVLSVLMRKERIMLEFLIARMKTNDIRSWEAEKNFVFLE